MTTTHKTAYISLEAPKRNIPERVYQEWLPRPLSSSLQGFFFFWLFIQKIHGESGLVGWVWVGLRAFCSWKMWGGGLDFVENKGDNPGMFLLLLS